MNALEKVQPSDYVELIHTRNGKVIDRRITGPKTGVKPLWIKVLKKLSFGKLYADDLITNVGKAHMALDLTESFLYTAIGTDNGTILPLAATNTQLGAETDREASTNDRITTNVTNDTARYTTTFSFTGDTNIQESGVFTAASNGDLLARQTFDVLSMKNGDELTVVWKVVVT